jgi:PAS domain S-box-containing protein
LDRRFVSGKVKVDSQFSSQIQDLQRQVARLEERTGGELADALDDLSIGLQGLLVSGEELLRRAEGQPRPAQELADDPEGVATLEALRQSEKKYRQLVELAQEGMWAIDAEANTTFVNPRMAEMLGYSVRDMQGQHLFSFMDERGVEICERNLERRRQGIKEQHNFEFLRKDGTRVCTSLETCPITDEQGNYVGALALVADITQRRQAEERQKAQNQFITTVFESLKHPFYVVNAHDYSIEMANSAAIEGELPASVTCYALTHKRTAPCGDAEHLCPMDEIKKTGKPVVVEHLHYDQAGNRRYFEVHAHPIFDDEGEVAQIIEYTLDITDRKQIEQALRTARDELELRVQDRTQALAMANQSLRAEIAERQQAEETLRESEERYRRLVELSFEAVAIHSQGTVVYVNPPAVTLLGGSSPGELVGRPIRDFVHPDYWNMVQARVQQVGEQGTGVPLVEQKLIRLDGTSVDVEIASVPITYQGRSAIQSVIHDVSPRKQAEAEREQERMRIARNLHDSLGHSLGYLHLKLDELAGSRALSENLEIRQELAQMRDVTNEAYEVVRGMLAASLPNTSTELATALLVKARSIGQRGDFKVQLASEGQSRSLSPVVQQQLLYLFQEALVNVEKHAEAKSVDINLVWGEDTLTVSLSDDGKGFDPERIQSEGHFGLAIMQERAREINGQLTLTSGPDSGTLLVLRLPLDAVSQSPRPV